MLFLSPGVFFELSNQFHIIQICLSPITLLRHPVVLWACAMWSVTFTWVIIQGAVASQIFSAPPYVTLRQRQVNFWRPQVENVSEWRGSVKQQAGACQKQQSNHQHLENNGIFHVGDSH
jgi:hypothetical protein